MVIFKDEPMNTIDWVCNECGQKHGSRIPELACYHMGACDVCGEMRAVTEPRDYGYLDLDRKDVDNESNT